MSMPLPLPKDAIDAYAWFGNWPHWPVPGLGEDALLQRMDRLAIRSAIVLPLAGAFCHAGDGNAELAALVGRHAGRLVGIAAYDPRQSPSPLPIMESAKAAGLRGLALLPANHGYALGSEPAAEEALELAGEWGWPVYLPVRLIMSWWMPVTPTESILAAAQRHPQTQIVVASANYGELAVVLRGLAQCPNIHIETSGLQSLNAVQKLGDAGHAGRLLLGTGQPMQLPECNLVKLAYPNLPPADIRAILADNAARLFAL